MAVELPPIIQEIRNIITGQKAVREQAQLIKDIRAHIDTTRKSIEKQRFAIIKYVAALAFMSDRLVRSSKLMGALGQVTQSLTGAFTDLAVVPLLPALIPLIGPMTSLIGFMGEHQAVAAFTGSIILLASALHRLFLGARIAGFIFHEAFTIKMRDAITRLFGAKKKMDELSEATQALGMVRGGEEAAKTARTTVTRGASRASHVKLSRIEGQAFIIYRKMLGLLAAIALHMRAIDETLLLQTITGIGKGAPTGVAAAKKAPKIPGAPGAKVPPILPAFNVKGLISLIGRFARLAFWVTVVVAGFNGLLNSFDRLNRIFGPLGLGFSVPSVSDKMEALGKVFTVFFAAIGTIVELFVLITTGPIALVVATLKAIFTGDLSVITDTLKRLGGEIIGSLYSLGRTIDDVSGGALTRFKNFFHGELVPAIRGALDSIGTWFKALPGDVSGWLMGVRGNIASWLGSIPDAIWNMLPAWLKNAIHGAGNIASTVGSGVEDFFNRLRGRQGGTREIPETGYYKLHRGERVVSYDRSSTVSGTQNVTINYAPQFANEGFGFASRHSMDLRFSFLGALGSVR